MTEGPPAAPGTGANASQVLWPAGPHYFDLTGSQGAVAWVRYRVWAADWHARTLQAVAGPAANYDRLVGIEMALDGVLNGLSGAFDAATALLIGSAEVKLDVRENQRLEVHRYSWGQARRLMKAPVIGTNTDGSAKDDVWQIILDVDNALAGQHDPVPTGWLAQLRRLRNRVAHQDTLARHHAWPTSSNISAFSGTNQSAFDQLARACDQVSDLTERMIALAIQLGTHEPQAGWARPR